MMTINLRSFVQKTVDKAYFYMSKGGNQNRFFGSDRSRLATTLRRPEDYIRSFTEINYIANLITRIAGDTAKLEWNLTNKKGEIIEDSKSAILIRRPSETLTWSDMVMTTVAHIMLDGNAFWLMDTTNALAALQGVPSAIKVCNPALTDVISLEGEEIFSRTFSNETSIRNYRLEIGQSRVVNLPKEFVIHMKIPGPFNVLRGMGKIQANRPQLEAESYQTIFNSLFFKQGAKSSLLAKPSDPMGPKEFDNWKKQFRDEVEGFMNWEKTIIMPHGTDISPINLSHKDMDFIEQRGMAREDIDAIFEVPPIVAGRLKNVQNYSTSDQLRVYFTFTVPKWAKIVRDGIQQVVNVIDPDLTFNFIFPKSIDVKDQADAGAKLFDRGAITQNEYREMLDMKPLDDEIAEDRFISANLIPVEFQADTSTEESKSIGAKVEGVPLTPGEDQSRFPQSTTMTPKQAGIHRSASAVKKRIASKISKEIEKYYAALESRVLDGLGKSIDITDMKAADIDDVFDFSVEVEESRKAAKRFYTSAVTISLAQINDLFDSDIDITFNNPKVVLLVDVLGKRFEDTTVNSRKNEILKIITTSLDESLPLSEISGRIKDHFETLRGASAWRADRIARTEASHAWDQSAFLSYEELGVRIVDVVGCEDNDTDCNAKGVPLREARNLVFHPNHTGTIVPA